MSRPALRTLSSYSHELRHADDEWRLRVLVHEFGLNWYDSPVPDRMALVADEPAPIDPRWDAFVAAYVEHLCWHADLASPRWAFGPGRYLDHVWFVAGWSATLKVEAIVHAPAAFESHGVLVSDRELLVV
jgi:hypothetical protein